MTSLNRIKQGDFSIEQSYNLEQIKNNDFKLLKIEECLNQYKIVTVDSFLENKIKNGSLLNNIYNEDVIIFKNKNDQILALYKI